MYKIWRFFVLHCCYLLNFPELNQSCYLKVWSVEMANEQGAKEDEQGGKEREV